MPHTPTPWKAEKWHDIKSTTIHGPDHLAIGNMKKKDDAAFAVHAANCHEELLVALRRLVARAESATHYLEVVDDEDDQQAINKFVVAIQLGKDAIAKAEGRTS
jgi:hypothetical protein